MLSELIPELFPENHQPPGVDDRCHRPDVCDCCHKPPRAGVLLYAGYERDYQWLCLWCWARNMRFVEIRDPACFHCGKPIVDGGFFFDWPSFGWIDTHAECFLATIKALRNADADEAGRELTAQIAQADAAGDELRVDALLREKDRLNRGRGGC